MVVILFLSGGIDRFKGDPAEYGLPLSRPPQQQFICKKLTLPGSFRKSSLGRQGEAGIVGVSVVLMVTTGVPDLQKY